MIKNSHHQKGSAHVVIIVILVIALLGALSFVFWQNFMSKDSEKNESVGQTSTQTGTSKKINYITYQTDTHPISFTYPDTWKLENAQGSDEYRFSRSVDVKTDEGNVLSFSVGGQGIGGTCGGVIPVRSTIDVVPTTLKTPKPTTMSYTVTPNSDGSYSATFGLTDTYTKVGETEICNNTFYYLFNSGSDVYMLIGFKGTKQFANLSDAKKFVSSDEYAAIKKMMLTLKY